MKSSGLSLDLFSAVSLSATVSKGFPSVFFSSVDTVELNTKSKFICSSALERFEKCGPRIEEKEEFAPTCRKYDLDFVSLIAPTSADRIAKIAASAEGFVYCVSSLGVTGMRSNITTDIGAMVKLVREANPSIPCAIGFGISTPEQAAKMAKEADGVIVGSAIVNRVAEYGLDAAPVVYEYVKSMKDAIR